MKKISLSSIIICSIVRNAERGLRKNVPVIRKLCERFADYRIVIYENDSTDKTKEILKEWVEKDDDHVIALMNDIGAEQTIPTVKSVVSNPFFSRRRIEKMASLRNQYMQYIDDCHLEADYLMVVDLDVAQLNLESILSSFEDDVPEWDAVTAYGYSLGPMLRRRYHDTYALTELEKVNQPQTESLILSNAYRFANLLANDEWIPVFSAFGGLAIYRFESIKGLRYQVLDNDDPRVEVHCEHFSIYKQMTERGTSRIYINPHMVLKYQSLSVALVGNTLKRMFSELISRLL